MRRERETDRQTDGMLGKTADWHEPHTAQDTALFSCFLTCMTLGKMFNLLSHSNPIHTHKGILYFVWMLQRVRKTSQELGSKTY